MLGFQNAMKKEHSKGFPDEANLIGPLSWLCPMLIGALADPEESRSGPDTTQSLRTESSIKRGAGIEPFTKALAVVDTSDNDWVRRSPEYHLGRAADHLHLWHDGDQPQDHVSHAATRLLIALTLRELK